MQSTNSLLASCSDVALFGVASDNSLTAARSQTLAFFKAAPAQYECIFTAGASGALDLLARSFPWQQGSCFMPTVVNHTCDASSSPSIKILEPNFRFQVYV
jgi:selenocysteine lyase/cysteine desulfurase